ncbi:MAG: hypothetical protein PXZ08_00940, partial [Actinomycetota bacterium]|nr:hypothetical protein [Actinomycetota bacterium]
MRFRRTTMVANIVIIGATLPAVGFGVASSSNGAAPLFEYDSSATGSWSTQGLSADLGGHSIIGGAHAVAGDGEFALSARLENGDLGLFVRNASTTTAFYNLTTLVNAPAAAADPNVFLDPFGNVDVVYVSTHSRLILITPHVVSTPLTSTTTSHVSSHVIPANQSNVPSGGVTSSAPFNVTDLTVVSHVPMSPGVVSVSVSSMSAMIVDRSTKGDAVVLPMQWRQLNTPPSLGAAVDVTALTGSPTLLNTPVSLPGNTSAFAATTTAGHVEYFSQTVAGTGSWTATDVTNLSVSPPSTGQLSIATNGPTIYIASLSTANHVQLFAASSTSAALWKYRDLTSVITGSPVWTGNIFLSATPTSINVAGRAANWGDIYDYTDTLPAITWTSNDVSLSAGATTASTIAGVTGLFNGTSLQLFATGVGTVAARGVGVYAIPRNDWTRAITDGWPIISETGGLGTLSAPWVGFAPPTPLTQSPDYLMGRSILASKKRETWLSFWTVSGPLTPADQTPASYYNHGFLAGQWVAQQIDQYHLTGMNLKPNWVILD